MKKILAIITLLAVCMSFLTGCTNSVANSLTYYNKAAIDISVNFRGSLIPVAKDNGKMEIKDIKRGTYTYETTFKPPNGTTVKSEGAVSGQVSLSAGTKILVVYSSIFSDGVYTVSATISSSEDLSGGDDNPILP